MFHDTNKTKDHKGGGNYWSMWWFSLGEYIRFFFYMSLQSKSFCPIFLHYWNIVSIKNVIFHKPFAYVFLFLFLCIYVCHALILVLTNPCSKADFTRFLAKDFKDWGLKDSRESTWNTPGTDRTTVFLVSFLDVSLSACVILYVFRFYFAVIVSSKSVWRKIGLQKSKCGFICSTSTFVFSFFFFFAFVGFLPASVCCGFLTLALPNRSLKNSHTHTHTFARLLFFFVSQLFAEQIQYILSPSAGIRKAQAKKKMWQIWKKIVSPPPHTHTHQHIVYFFSLSLTQSLHTVSFAY